MAVSQGAEPDPVPEDAGDERLVPGRRRLGVPARAGSRCSASPTPSRSARRRRAGPGRLSPDMPFEVLAHHAVDFWLCGEDLPLPDNRVTLDERRRDPPQPRREEQRRGRQAAAPQAATACSATWACTSTTCWTTASTCTRACRSARPRTRPAPSGSAPTRQLERARRELQGPRPGQPLRRGHQLLPEHRRGEPVADRHRQRPAGRRPPDRTPRLRPAARWPTLAVHRVVIVGGGFGGLFAAKFLRRAPVEVTLVDARNYHLFQPLLYQLATGILSAGRGRAADPRHPAPPRAT